MNISKRSICATNQRMQTHLTKNKKRGFSLIEIVIVIAILVVLLAVLAPSLMTYTERSRAQKDVTTMDEVVNSVQLAMADQDCYDEMIKYSCDNNFITYTDSSGNYGQVIADGEYWAPDGLGRATTITFNPEKDSNGDTIYRLENAIVNDMTFGNGSVAENRVMQGTQTENNQCYLKNASLNGSQTGYLYNRIRQSIGDDVITTSATYANSSFTIFIRFNQKDGVTVADVNGSFNGTNLSPDSSASKGSGTTTYDPTTKEPIVNTNHVSGKTQSNFSSSALQGGGTTTVIPSYKEPYAGTLIIPEGCKYTTAAGKVYGPGSEYPTVVATGDKYETKDFEYRYNYQRTYSAWKQVTTQNGWGVWAKDTTTTHFEDMMSTIGGKPVNTLTYVFVNSNVTVSPKFSTNATNLTSTFYQCSKLSDISNIIIPNGVTALNGTFTTCKALVDASGLLIPDSVTDMTRTFQQCSKLKTAPQFPKNLQILKTTFQMCSSLTTVPSIPSTVVDMQSAFIDCTSLVNAPDMSQANKVQNMLMTFQGCKSLRTAPQIPSSVTNIKQLFNGCTYLKTYVNNPNGDGDFSAYKLPNNVTNLTSLFYGCTLITKAPDISHLTNVTSMQETFAECTRLTGTIVINCNPTSYNKCFYKTKQPIVIDGSSTLLNELAATDYYNNVSVATGAITPSQPEGTFAFTISGKTYYAIEGMTWSQWVNSEYNTDGSTCGGGGVFYKGGNMCVSTDGTYNGKVYGSTVIVANKAYKTSTSSPTIPG